MCTSGVRCACIGHAVGNAMSIAVVERILGRPFKPRVLTPWFFVVVSSLDNPGFLLLNTSGPPTILNESSKCQKHLVSKLPFCPFTAFRKREINRRKSLNLTYLQFPSVHLRFFK